MKTMKKYPCVLTIAGTDPSGGAGIQADIKAISATGSYAASVITVLVAQNTQGVQAIHEIPASFVAEQLSSVFTDLNIDSVKIGMLHDESIIDIVASALEKFQPKQVVLDPVMFAKSGCALLKANTIHFLKKRLFSSVNIITPNLAEAEKLLGTAIENTDEMQAAAASLGDEFALNVLLKGGHLNSHKASDVLYLYQTSQYHWFHADRIITHNTHGTGCTLSSAIASYLAQSYSLNDAISAAKQYLTNAIKSGSEFQLGLGAGPVNHFYFLERETT